MEVITKDKSAKIIDYINYNIEDDRITSCKRLEDFIEYLKYRGYSEISRLTDFYRKFSNADGDCIFITYSFEVKGENSFPLLNDYVQMLRGGVS